MEIQNWIDQQPTGAASIHRQSQFGLRCSNIVSMAVAVAAGAAGAACAGPRAPWAPPGLQAQTGPTGPSGGETGPNRRDGAYRAHWRNRAYRPCGRNRPYRPCGRKRPYRPDRSHPARQALPAPRERNWPHGPTGPTGPQAQITPAAAVAERHIRMRTWWQQFDQLLANLRTAGFLSSN
jgi:hypothetical protein